MGREARQKSRYYYLDSDQGSRSVCKQVFLNTIGIASAGIHRTLQKQACGRVSDQRGKQLPWNNLVDATKDHVKYHTNFFNIQESKLLEQHK